MLKKRELSRVDMRVGKNIINQQLDEQTGEKKFSIVNVNGINILADIDEIAVFEQDNKQKTEYVLVRNSRTFALFKVDENGNLRRQFRVTCQREKTEKINFTVELKDLAVEGDIGLGDHATFFACDLSAVDYSLAANNTFSANMLDFEIASNDKITIMDTNTYTRFV